MNLKKNKPIMNSLKMFRRVLTSKNLLNNRRYYSRGGSCGEGEKILIYAYGISFMYMSGYLYKYRMEDEKNKYKPYKTMLWSCFESAVYSIGFPFTFLIALVVSVSRETMLLTKRLDTEYEQKQKRLENSIEKK